jgi:hypothetical protein
MKFKAAFYAAFILIKKITAVFLNNIVIKICCYSFKIKFILFK